MCYYLLPQTTPFPVKPVLQVQLYEPIVFTQLARPAAQGNGFCPHSSMSLKIYNGMSIFSFEYLIIR